MRDMAYLQQALTELGLEMGLPALEAGPGGEVQLRLESGALLGVSQSGEEVVVHWAEPVRHGAPALLLGAMRRAGHANSAAQAVQVGLRSVPAGEWLVVAQRLPAREVNAQRLREAAQFLRQWLSDVQSGA
jgi:type III secretion system chaperone SycN